MSSLLTQERYTQYRNMFNEDMDKCKDIKTMEDTWEEIYRALEKEGDIRSDQIENMDG